MEQPIANYAVAQCPCGTKIPFATDRMPVHCADCTEQVCQNCMGLPGKKMQCQCCYDDAQYMRRAA